MRISIDYILQQQNKSRYWLSQQTNVTYSNILRLCNNQTSSIRFDNIEKICNALDCSPNEIFSIEGNHEKTNTEK